MGALVPSLFGKKFASCRKRMWLTHKRSVCCVAGLLVLVSLFGKESHQIPSPRSITQTTIIPATRVITVKIHINIMLFAMRITKIRTLHRSLWSPSRHAMRRTSVKDGIGVWTPLSEHSSANSPSYITSFLTMYKQDKATGHSPPK